MFFNYLPVFFTKLVLISLLKFTKMNWKKLENVEELNEIIKASFAKPQLIFKHSTRCIISKMALKNFEADFLLEEVMETYYLDLITHRAVSNKITDHFNITHQSPQIVLIKNGEAIYNASHEGIDAGNLKRYL